MTAEQVAIAAAEEIAALEPNYNIPEGEDVEADIQAASAIILRHMQPLVEKIEEWKHGWSCWREARSIIGEASVPVLDSSMICALHEMRARMSTLVEQRGKLLAACVCYRDADPPVRGEAYRELMDVIAECEKEKL